MRPNPPNRVFMRKTKDLPNIGELRRRLDYGHYGQKRDIEFYNAFRQYAVDFVTNQGIKGDDLVKWRTRSHQDGLFEMAVCFLDRDGNGQKYWPEDKSNPFFGELQYYKKSRSIRSAVIQLFFRSNQQRKSKPSPDKGDKTSDIDDVGEVDDSSINPSASESTQLQNPVGCVSNPSPYCNSSFRPQQEEASAQPFDCDHPIPSTDSYDVPVSPPLRTPLPNPKPTMNKRPASADQATISSRKKRARVPGGPSTASPLTSPQAWRNFAPRDRHEDNLINELRYTSSGRFSKPTERLGMVDTVKNIAEFSSGDERSSSPLPRPKAPEAVMIAPDEQQNSGTLSSVGLVASNTGVQTDHERLGRTADVLAVQNNVAEENTRSRSSTATAVPDLSTLRNIPKPSTPAKTSFGYRVRRTKAIGRSRILPADEAVQNREFARKTTNGVSFWTLDAVASASPRSLEPAHEAGALSQMSSAQARSVDQQAPGAQPEGEAGSETQPAERTENRPAEQPTAQTPGPVQNPCVNQAASSTLLQPTPQVQPPPEDNTSQAIAPVETATEGSSATDQQSVSSTEPSLQSSSAHKADSTRQDVAADQPAPQSDAGVDMSLQDAIWRSNPVSRIDPRKRTAPQPKGPSSMEQSKQSESWRSLAQNSPSNFMRAASMPPDLAKRTFFPPPMQPQPTATKTTPTTPTTPTAPDVLMPPPSLPSAGPKKEPKEKTKAGGRVRTRYWVYTSPQECVGWDPKNTFGKKTLAELVNELQFKGKFTKIVLKLEGCKPGFKVEIPLGDEQEFGDTKTEFEKQMRKHVTEQRGKGNGDEIHFTVYIQPKWEEVIEIEESDDDEQESFF